jgi:hypothetical protein
MKGLPFDSIELSMPSMNTSDHCGQQYAFPFIINRSAEFA